MFVINSFCTQITIGYWLYIFARNSFFERISIALADADAYPFARTLPWANETVTTIRIHDLKQTFYMQIIFTNKYFHHQFLFCPPRTKTATHTSSKDMRSLPSLQLSNLAPHCQREWFWLKSWCRSEIVQKPFGNREKITKEWPLNTQ